MVTRSSDDDLKEHARAVEAQRRWRVLQPLAATPRNRVDAVAAAAEKLGIGIAQTYKLIAACRHNPDAKALQPGIPGPKNVSRLHSDVEQVIERQIQRVYLTPERPTLEILREGIRRICDERKLPVPSMKAVRTRVQRISEKRKTRARKGFKAAHDHHVLAWPTPRASAPLEVVQIDHTELDVMAVGGPDRKPIGRVFLTVVIDVFSRCVLGFSLSFKANAADSLAAALVQAFSPKEAWLEQHGAQVEWPVFGIPKRIHVDHGSDFISEAFKRGCEKYGIELTYRERGKPHQTGIVERFMGTISKRIKSLPGTTFSNVVERGSYKSAKRAVLTVPELRDILIQEILGVYHHRVHSSLGMTPLAEWKTGLETHGLPALPGDGELKAMILDFLPFEWRTVSREGIHIFGEIYFHPDLSVYLEQKDRLVRVRYDPEDISMIFVEMLNGDHFAIRHPEVQNVSRREHKTWRAARKQPQSENDRRITLEAIRAREGIIKHARDETRRARRPGKNGRISAPQQFADSQAPDGLRQGEASLPLDENWEPGAESGQNDEWEINPRD